jgi:hypothetical protein
MPAVLYKASGSQRPARQTVLQSVLCDCYTEARIPYSSEAELSPTRAPRSRQVVQANSKRLPYRAEGYETFSNFSATAWHRRGTLFFLWLAHHKRPIVKSHIVCVNPAAPPAVHRRASLHVDDIIIPFKQDSIRKQAASCLFFTTVSFESRSAFTTCIPDTHDASSQCRFTTVKST